MKFEIKTALAFSSKPLYADKICNISIPWIFKVERD